MWQAPGNLSLSELITLGGSTTIDVNAQQVSTFQAPNSTGQHTLGFVFSALHNGHRIRVGVTLEINVVDSSQDDRGDWIFTGANNSMNEDASLFALNGSTLETTSDASGLTNIHAHLNTFDAHEMTNYQLSGTMRSSDPEGRGLIGVTFFSNIPESNDYLRLQVYNNDTKLAPHGDTNCVGDVSIGYGMDSGEEYSFKVQAVNNTDAQQTEVKAKMWKTGTTEPDWQIDCKDSSASRLIKGTYGAWTMGTGSRGWG